MEQDSSSCALKDFIWALIKKKALVCMIRLHYPCEIAFSFIAALNWIGEILILQRLPDRFWV